MGLGIREWVITGVVIAATLYVGMLKLEIHGLKAENKELNDRMVAIETLSKEAQREAEVKVVEVVKEVEVVKKETEYKIKKIKEYVRDENKSDCSNAMDFARSYF